jgi:hypothetical protein
LKYLYSLALAYFSIYNLWGQSIQLNNEKIALKNIQYLQFENKLNEKLVVVQFKSKEGIDFLKSTHLNIIDYIDRYTIILTGTDILKLPYQLINGWTIYEGKYKIDPGLLELNGNVDINIYWNKKASISELKSLLNNYTEAYFYPKQKWDKRSVYQVRISANNLISLSEHSNIINIGKVVEDEPLLEHSKAYVNANRAINSIQRGGLGLTGRNIVVGVGDDAHPFHIDIIDRLINFNSQNASAHSYHVATTVAGAGILDPLYTGFAPKAKIVANYFSNILSESETYLSDFGMTLTNNSYGADLNNCNAFGLYSIVSRMLDDQLNDNHKLLHIFAAGNSANRTCTPYPFKFGTIAGHYQATKNALVVANIGKTETSISGTSSIGPTLDGRMKPEIAAMGTNLRAGGNNNNYYNNTGTSMACPGVAGAATLLSERYLQLKNQMPDGALIKTLLMNGATDIGNPGPDYSFGFGLVNLDNSIKMLEENNYIYDSLNTNTTKTFTINVPSNTSELKVMLYWHDLSANPSASKTLINDLDLSIITPTQNTIRPWILNPHPTQVNNPATRGIDTINNVEQVTISNPTPGTYTIHIAGNNLATTRQTFYIAYQNISNNLSLRFPLGGETIVAGNAQYIYWNSPFSTGNTLIEFSLDNGSTYNTIANINNPTQRSFAYTFNSAIYSNTCKIRITQNGVTTTSDNFIIAPRPTVTVANANEQCPGSFKINWNNITNATSYNIYKKVNDEMVLLSTTTANTFTVNNLHPDSTYWLAVSAVRNNYESLRSSAVFRTPNNGNCSGYNNGDLTIYNFTPNESGRKYTQREFSNTTPLVVDIWNMSGNITSNYSISYQINNNPWVVNNYNTVINPGTKATINIGNIDLSNPDKYNIKVVVKNNTITDTNSLNDTLVKTIYHWANEPINFANDLLYDFENNNFQIKGKSVIGIDSLEHLDFITNHSNGIVQSFMNSTLSLNGRNGISMYNYRNVGNDILNAAKNALIATYNLSNEDTATSEIRLEFNYILPNIPQFDSLNSIWIRQSDTSQWVNLMEYVVDTSNYTSQTSGSISLTDIHRNNHWDFTSSFQVKWEQFSTIPLSSNYDGHGVTLDNINLYKVKNDIYIVGTNEIYHYNCGLGNQVPIKVDVANGVNNTVYNISISYQIDNGSIITETIDSIPAKDTITYTFNVPADLSIDKEYLFNTWVYLASDTYKNNDSLLKFSIYNQPIINTFPYYEDFETNDGFFFEDGIKKSFQYGTINKNYIKYAASGTKAWATDTVSVYDDMVNTSLYAPCFDISNLQNPTLSFSLAFITENASRDDSNMIFDYAFIEYTNNGNDWIRLGAKGEGYNWYNHHKNVFLGTQQPYWQVATIPIPKTGNIFSFRIRFVSDKGGAIDGIAIDDIHIYDKQFDIYNSDSLNAAIVSNIISQDTLKIYNNTTKLAEIQTQQITIPINFQTYKHNELFNEWKSQYFLPRSYKIISANQNQTNDSIFFRIYITDDNIKTIRNDNSCPSCTHPNDIYRFGVSIYKDKNDKSTINNTLKDNDTSNYYFINTQNVRWIPYDNGYIAQFTAPYLGEIWFNGGGPTQMQHLGAPSVTLQGQALAITKAQLNWTSHIDSSIEIYHLQRKYNDTSSNFETIFSTNSTNNSNIQNYYHLDEPVLNGEPIEYRIAYQLKGNNNSIFYSPSVLLDWSNVQDTFLVYPNPVTDGKINIVWNKKDDNPLYWSLITSDGRKLYTEAFKDKNHYADKLELNIKSNLIESGIYIIRITSSKKTYDFKIVIIK